MKKQNVKIEFDGKLYDRDLIVSYMRDDLREKLHSEWTDEKGGEQDFFEAYCELLYNETGKNLKSKAETGINARPRETAYTC